MSEEKLIFPQQAALYIDVYCWECKRLVALSNTIEYEGRRYCNKCNEKMFTTDHTMNYCISHNSQEHERYYSSMAEYSTHYQLCKVHNPGKCQECDRLRKLMVQNLLNKS